MSSNELPSNMGKKIADALKKQSKAAIKDDSNPIHSIEASAVKNDAHETAHHATNSIGIESPYDDLDMYSNPISEEQENERASEDYAPIFKMETGEISDNPDFTLNLDAEEDEDEFEMPNNINVLKRLIAQLPNGVTKQTGAQIIRQTIEALGIPMKSVLQDAQRVKDVLNSSIKDCNFTIQEYKSNIRNLEKQNSNYQKQLSKLNDIIGLFVYTEK